MQLQQFLNDKLLAAMVTCCFDLSLLNSGPVWDASRRHSNVKMLNVSGVLFLSIHVPLSFYPSLFLSLSLSLYPCLSLSLFIHIPLSFYPSLFLSLSLSLYPSPSLSLSLILYLSTSTFLTLLSFLLSFFHSSFFSSSFLNFCISCTGISFRKCIF